MRMLIISILFALCGCGGKATPEIIDLSERICKEQGGLKEIDCRLIGCDYVHCKNGLNGWINSLKLIAK